MADLGNVKVVNLTGTMSAAGTSTQYLMPRGPATFSGVSVTTSTGANGVIVGACTVQVSNDNVNWLALGTLTSTGSGTAAPDGFASVVPWAYARFNVTTLTTGISATFAGQIGV